MTDQWTDRLSAYLDDDVSPDERRALDFHLAECTVCRTVLEDLRQVRDRAGALPPLSPGRDLWPAIAARIQEAGRDPKPRPRAGSRRLTFSIPQLIAAGIALMLGTGGAVWLGIRSGAVKGAPLTTAATAASTALSVRTAGASALPHYDAAVADLQQVLEKGRSRLDTATVRVLEQNLARIDRAIGEARQALVADPANVYLNGHLAETRMWKLELLRRAAALASAAS